MRKSLVLVPILLALGIFPAFAQVQSPRSVPLVGALTHNTKGFKTEILKGLRELGYIDGKNFDLELRLARGRGQSSTAAAAELVRLRPDVIITMSTHLTRAMKRATQTIPVVFKLQNDPVRTGLVESMARPGGNLTGITGSLPEIRIKMLGLLKESFPGISRVAYVLPRKRTVTKRFNTRGGPVMKRFGISARALGIHVQIVRIQLRKGIPEINEAFSYILREKIDGIILGGHPGINRYRKQIVTLMEKIQVPAIYRNVGWVRMGGLMSYGPDNQELGRRAAYFVDRILRGEKPANLPVERPTKTKLVINLKTAKRQGFKIPPEVLMFADKVIQ